MLAYMRWRHLDFKILVKRRKIIFINITREDAPVMAPESSQPISESSASSVDDLKLCVPAN